MKALILADPNSSHTIKWVTSLASKRIEVLLYGLGKLRVDSYKSYSNVHVKCDEDVKITRNEGSIQKLSYLKVIPEIRRLIDTFRPDILHAHYASSYGFIGALLNFHPFVVSVWGSDVYSFPNKSFAHRGIIKYVLSKADLICSTSYSMALKTQMYTDKHIYVVPFGVDVSIFCPMKVNSFWDKEASVVGTVKTLEEKYGIEYLIKGFAKFVSRYPNFPVRLLIVGGGSLESKLKKICEELNIGSKVWFTGRVPYEEVPKYHNMLSIFVSVSDSESFGVAVIEAMACGKPVIVSNVGGLPEVTCDGKTGFIVRAKNENDVYRAISFLLFKPSLLEKMGRMGKKRVEKVYAWHVCLSKMLSLYDLALNRGVTL